MKLHGTYFGSGFYGGLGCRLFGTCQTMGYRTRTPVPSLVLTYARVAIPLYARRYFGSLGR